VIPLPDITPVLIGLVVLYYVVGCLLLSLVLGAATFVGMETWRHFAERRKGKTDA
jgi:hypothetical protein